VSCASPVVAAPPQTLEALWERAQDLAGRTVGELAERCQREVPDSGKHAKGLVGQLVEQCLGSDARNLDGPDFQKLCVELKTIPLARDGRPRESTFVCSISLGEVDTADWKRSRVFRKLQRVLWVPVESDLSLPLSARRIGHPRLWSPSEEQEALLRHDWEDSIGLIGSGQLEQISAHLGQVLQVRPKAANSRVRTTGMDDLGFVRTLPLGFYLRPTFTQEIMRGSEA